jgi:hypothetical protein
VGVSEICVTTARHQRLEQLAWVGKQYQQAILSYYFASPNSTKELPKSVGQLELDDRYPSVRRHLRRPYEEPISERSELGLHRNSAGRIDGVCISIADTINDINEQRLAKCFMAQTRAQTQ